MLAPYRSVLATPGAKRFTAAGLLARTPISTMTLGIVLLVEHLSGSYGFAGTVSAAYMGGAAAASPVLGRFIDRFGQRRVLLPAFAGFASGLLAMMVSLELGWPSLATYAAAAVGGIAYPPVGSCIRARWSSALSGPALHTAFSLEAMVDEMLFILGPVLVTVLAVQVDPSVALLAVLVVAVVGGGLLSGLRATEPPVSTASSLGHRSERLPWGWLSLLMSAAACLGSLFGATEVATVAFAAEHGQPQVTGVLLAIWAAGSLIAGFITGAFSWSASAGQRYRWGASGMAVAMAPLPFIDSVALMGVVLFFGGFAISPTMIASISLIEAKVPAERLTEGLTLVTTGIAFGIAPGAATAGWMIDALGASRGFYVSVISGVLAALLAWLTLAGREIPSVPRALDRQVAGAP
ncbi:MAG: MFS transporter [Nocardioidaceae bacterium]